MEKAGTETAYGLLVENGRIPCVVKRTHGIYRAGHRYSFTPAQVERELQRPDGPRFEPDVETEEAEDLTRIPGVTAADQQRLYDRGITRADQIAMVRELQAPEVRTALTSYFNSDSSEEGRRRLALRRLHEAVAQRGLVASLEEKAPASLQAINDALVALSEAEATEGDAELLSVHLGELGGEALEQLAVPLGKAYSAVAGPPGNRKPETLARGIVAAIGPEPEG